MNLTEKNPPASIERINAIARLSAIHPTSWLGNFWTVSDGAMIEDLIRIYSTDELVERQQTYEIADYFADHLLIGDDSGGRLILLDRASMMHFYLLDAGCPSIDDVEVFASLEALVAAVVSELNAYSGDAPCRS
jgi:hypothetical protein